MRHRRTGTEEPVSVSLDADGVLEKMPMDGWLGEVGETGRKTKLGRVPTALVPAGLLADPAVSLRVWESLDRSCTFVLCKVEMHAKGLTSNSGTQGSRPLKRQSRAVRFGCNAPGRVAE